MAAQWFRRSEQHSFGLRRSLPLVLVTWYVCSGPYSRTCHAQELDSRPEKMIYDSHRDVTVRFSMEMPSRRVVPWEWDGASWRRVDSVGPALVSFAAAFDSWREVTVVVGQSRSTTMETWEWDGVDWTFLTDSTSGGPAPCLTSTMVFDSVRGVAILWGYDRSHWEWDGTEWHGDPQRPCSASMESVSFDSHRGIVVGVNFEYDPVCESCEDHFTYLPAPPIDIEIPYSSLNGMQVQYDAATMDVVVFGGATVTFLDIPFPYTECDLELALEHHLSETWIRGSNGEWRLGASDCPGPRLQPAMAYDASRGVVVLYGGHQAPRVDWFLSLECLGEPVLGIPGSLRRPESCTDEQRSDPAQNTWEWNGEQWSLEATRFSAFLERVESAEKPETGRLRNSRSTSDPEFIWLAWRMNDMVVECETRLLGANHVTRCLAESLRRLGDDSRFRSLIERYRAPEE